MNEIITVDNCNRLCNEYQARPNESKSGAWVVVYNWCFQNGMDLNENDLSGLERVIKFLESNVKK